MVVDAGWCWWMSSWSELCFICKKEEAKPVSPELWGLGVLTWSIPFLELKHTHAHTHTHTMCVRRNGFIPSNWKTKLSQNEEGYRFVKMFTENGLLVLLRHFELVFVFISFDSGMRLCSCSYSLCFAFKQDLCLRTLKSSSLRQLTQRKSITCLCNQCESTGQWFELTVVSFPSCTMLLLLRWLHNLILESMIN